MRTDEDIFNDLVVGDKVKYYQNNDQGTGYFEATVVSKENIHQLELNTMGAIRRWCMCNSCWHYDGPLEKISKEKIC